MTNEEFRIGPIPGVSETQGVLLVEAVQALVREAIKAINNGDNQILGLTVLEGQVGFCTKSGVNGELEHLTDLSQYWNSQIHGGEN